MQYSCMVHAKRKQAAPAGGALAHKEFVGRNLRITIAAIGMRQADAAREMGISPSKLGNWLRGDNYPDPFLVTRFAADHAAPLEMIYQGTAAFAPPSLAAAYAEARRRWEAGALDI